MKIEILHPKDIKTGLEDLNKMILEQVSRFNFLEEAEELEKAKKVNRGNVAEGLIGAALYAKLIKRSEITSEDAKSVISSMSSQSGGDEGGKVVKNLSTKKGNKTFIFRLGLLSYDYINGFSNPKYIESAYEIESAVDFVNNSEVCTSFLEKVYKEKGSDIIEVKCIGLEDQKGTKVDVYVESQKIKDVKISLSLKALSKQMGQVGGGNWRLDPSKKKQVRGLADLLEGIFDVRLPDDYASEYLEAVKSFTVSDNRNATRAALLEIITKIYKDVEVKCRAITHPEKKRDDKKYISFLKKLGSGIVHEATSGEPGVLLLQLKRGSYNLVDFSNLVDLDYAKMQEFMKKNNKNCEIKVELTRVDAPYLNVYLIIKDLSGSAQPEIKEKIISIRPKVTSNPERTEFRHYVQKEKGLMTLLDMFL